MPCRLVPSLILIALAAGPLFAGDWTQFRGPHGAGVSDETGLPLHWSANENLAWQTKLPGAGTSSPIVRGDHIYLTCYSGYGLDEADPGEMNDLMRHVVCVDRRSGDILWHKTFAPELPESKYQGNGARHGYSSSTPTTDGERLYVFFGRSGVFALNLDNGETLWQADVGDRTDGWGSSNSPLLYQNLLIVNASSESQSLVALDRTTGKEAWRTGGMQRSWTTPILVNAPDGQTELVVSVKDWLLGFDPASGKELWRAEGIHDYVCPSPVAHDGIIYALGGRQNTATAVRAGGRGDVTKTHVLWRTNKGSNVSSPVYHQDHLYWVHERKGTAYCLDAKNGEPVYEERIEPRPGTVYSSPVIADGRLYIVSQNNGTYVLAAKPKFELLAHNTLDDDSRANASPAISHGHIYLRTDRALYSIGKP